MSTLDSECESLLTDIRNKTPAATTLFRRLKAEERNETNFLWHNPIQENKIRRKGKKGEGALELINEASKISGLKKKVVVFLYTTNEQSEKENQAQAHKKRTIHLGTNLSKRLETVNYETLLEETEDTKLMEWCAMFMYRKT